jgi:hypothetical protein
VTRLGVGAAVALALAGALVGACTGKPAPEAAAARGVEPESPPGKALATSATATTATATTAATIGGGAPADAAVDASIADAATSPEPTVRVKVVTIGMHVGGGPYDEITKAPMKRSVEPRFVELTRCWKHVTSSPRPADAGVDLVIEAGGGRARVSNPRTQIQGDGFVPCVVAFFEGVDFQKPRNGKTVVSYSVRFTPLGD